MFINFFSAIRGISTFRLYVIVFAFSISFLHSSDGKIIKPIPPITQDGLVLHFDLNGTLMLFDSIKAVYGEYALLSLLSESTLAIWEQGGEKVSFKEYVFTKLLPGDKSDIALKKQRQKMISQFVSWIEQNNPELCQEVLSKYEYLKQTFIDPASNQIKKSIFPSFYVLLEKLQACQISYKLILCTFGGDLNDAAGLIENTCTGVRFSHYGKFEGCQLKLNDDEKLSDAASIFQLYQNSIGHIAIFNDWKEWNADGELGRSGKPFLFDSSASHPLSLFFDDNVTGKSLDIVRPIDIAGQAASSPDLFGRCMFRVDTMEAIMDKDYYVKLVAQALLQNGYHDMYIKMTQ